MIDCNVVRRALIVVVMMDANPAGRLTALPAGDLVERVDAPGADGQLGAQATG